jgi:hypothetical protein
MTATLGPLADEGRPDTRSVVSSAVRTDARRP